MDIFSKIAAGEIPSYKCAADDRFYAFLDINPIVKGHTLVIPRREVDYIFDMDDEEIAAFQVFAKKVAVAMDEYMKGLPPKDETGPYRDIPVYDEPILDAFSEQFLGSTGDRTE